MAQPRIMLASFDEATALLATLDLRASPAPTGRAFLLGQSLSHCAQSIRCSLAGYPQLRSALFRATLGRVGLHKFLRQGFMTHDRATKLPGAQCISSDVSAHDGAAELLAAIAAFRAHAGPLQPHLAFGALDAAVYERVHAMHLADHLSAFESLPRA